MTLLPRLCENPNCRAVIESLRRDARYCSGACRQAAYLARTYGGPILLRPDPNVCTCRCGHQHESPGLRRYARHRFDQMETGL